MRPLTRLSHWFRTPRVGTLPLSEEWRGKPTQTLPRWTRPGIQRTAFDFLRIFDREALEGLKHLLLQPDEPSLQRGRVLKFEGAPDRFRTWLPIRVRAIRTRELAQFGLDEMTENVTPPGA